MIRKLFIAFLILLAVGSTWMWVESERRGRLVWHAREHVDGASFMVWAENGEVRLTHWWFFEDSMTGMNATRNGLGFGYLVERVHDYQGHTVQIHRIWFPAWAPILLFAGYPFWVPIAAMVRWRLRRKRHRCVGCGYSLIGLVEPRCPECGLDVTIPVGATSDDYVEPVARFKVRHWTVMTLILVIAVGGALWIVFQPKVPKSIPSTVVTTTWPRRPVTPSWISQLPSLLSKRAWGGSKWNPSAISQGASSFLRWDLKKIGDVYRYGCSVCGDLAKQRLTLESDHESVDLQKDDPVTALKNGSITVHWQCERCMRMTPGPKVDQLYGSFHPQSPCAHCGFFTTDSDGKAKPWDGHICPDCGGWCENESPDQKAKPSDP